MAGDWVKMRCNLWTSPQVVRIVSALERPRAHIIGALHGVWSLFDAHSASGEPLTLPHGTLDTMTGTDGLEGAMIDVGWLEVNEQQDVTTYTLPRYEEHNGPTAKRRAQEQKRKKRVRKVSASMQTRGEERREDKSKGLTPLPPFHPGSVPLPTFLQTEGFREAWSEWIEHRKQLKKKLTPLAVTKQIKRLAALGEAAAIATIQHTIEKGWTGLQEPDRPAGQKPAFSSRGLDLGDQK